MSDKPKDSTGPRPNFFIIGAPKCGTSALFEYLKGHPKICMSSRKEPRFFSAMDREDDCQTLEEYLGLFKEATKKECLAIGEGSTANIYVPGALEKIKEFDPNAKVIAMVRNPIDVVQSLHSYNFWKLREDVEDFETAWRLQEDRMQGKNVPPRNLNPYHLQYGEIGLLGKQIQHVYEVFPAENVMVIVAEDMRKDNKAVYEKVLAFLGVPSDGRTEFPTVNESRGKGGTVANFFMAPPPFLIKLAKSFGWQHTGFRKKVASKMTKPIERKEISPELRAELVEYYRDDVALLGKLLNRDFSKWLQPKNQSAKTNG